MQKPADRQIVHELNPLTDPRWPSFIAQRPDASIFHSRGWLVALQKTYGYKPIAFTTSIGEQLSNALLFCRVSSWATGRRLVSLPFSDHCQPLAAGEDLEAIIEHLRHQRMVDRLKYIELRPVTYHRAVDLEPQYTKGDRFSYQSIDLRPDLDTLYKGFHDSCVRRKIRKAERENLTYEAGRSGDLLQKFRHLLLLTRRRHKLPPQPDAWFKNLVESLGESLVIRLLSKDGVPVSSILTLSYKKSLVYKYGCSDARFNSMGATPLLFWKAIQQAKTEGIEEFDLGRSGNNDQGLISFKRHLGAATADLRYYRDTPPKPEKGPSRSAVSSWAREALTSLPDSLFAGVGQLLYRHMG
jgi:hypothetical protein